MIQMAIISFSTVFVYNAEQDGIVSFWVALYAYSAR